MTLAEQLPEFQHRDTGGHVLVAFYDFTNENMDFSLAVSTDCVVLYGANADEVLESGDPALLEIWDVKTTEEILGHLSVYEVPINPDRVLKCFEDYANCNDVPF